MEIDGLSFVVGMVGAYALSCIFSVWKDKTLPNIKRKFERIRNKDNAKNETQNNNKWTDRQKKKFLKSLSSNKSSFFYFSHELQLIL